MVACFILNLQVLRSRGAPNRQTKPREAVEADLLPPSGGELRSPDVVLYEYVSAATSHACSCAAEATLASVHIGVAAPSHSGAAPVSGPPTISELEGRHEESPGTGDRHEQAVAFRDAYMELLADSAPDELDSLRREEPPMDDDGLANLIEALEAGSESFSRDQRSLLPPPSTASAAGGHEAGLAIEPNCRAATRGLFPTRTTTTGWVARQAARRQACQRSSPRLASCTCAFSQRSRRPSSGLLCCVAPCHVPREAIKTEERAGKRDGHSNGTNCARRVLSRPRVVPSCPRRGPGAHQPEVQKRDFAHTGTERHGTVKNANETDLGGPPNLEAAVSSVVSSSQKNAGQSP